MGTYFSEREFAQVEPAENAFRSPIPTQVISNGEFNPPAQTAQQKQVEARIRMMAEVRADGIKGQFIMDVQTDWVRDDYKQEGFVGFLKSVNQLEKSGLDPSKISVYDVKFENYVRQIFLNSDTSVAVLSGAPFDDKSWEFQTNQAIADGVNMVNKTAGSTRILGHAVVRPGQPGWMDEGDQALAEFEKTGDIKWATELSRVPEKSGTQNVYAEMGTSFATTAVIDPRFAAALLGTWIKGLGSSNVIWGTDSVFHGSPQWQIEALRRLEIPADMQRKYGFAPLGAANGPVKNQILGLNSARMYNINLRASYPRFTEDKFAQIKDEYRTAGTLDTLRDNAAHGWIARRSV